MNIDNPITTIDKMIHIHAAYLKPKLMIMLSNFTNIGKSSIKISKTQAITVFKNALQFKKQNGVVHAIAIFANKILRKKEIIKFTFTISNPELKQQNK